MREGNYYPTKKVGGGRLEIKIFYSETGRCDSSIEAQLTRLAH